MRDGLALLVGPDGDWMRENSPEFLAEFGDSDPDYDATLFAVKNLGFIKCMWDDLFIEITVHPRNVELSTLHAVLNVLSSSRAKLFRIRHFGQDWAQETVSSAREAISRMFELCADEVIE
jgi:hypothetical protein